MTTEIIATNGTGAHDDLTDLLNSFKSHDELVCMKPRTFAELRAAINEKLRSTSDKFLFDRIARNELGCGELLCEVANGEITYDHSSEAWYWWNGLHWQEDKGDNIHGLAADIISGVYRKAATEKYQKRLEVEALIKSTFGDRKDLSEDEREEKKQLQKQIDELKDGIKRAEDQARDLYKLSYIRNVLVFARATELLGLVGNEWDTQTHLLGVANAVIDLNTGKPVKPEPAQYIRTVAPVAYNAKATCPTWIRAIEEIFNHDLAMVEYVQRFLGYGLSGTCYESDFPVWHGKDGRNGKEFLLERVRSVLGGKLAGTVEAELLLKSKNPKGKNEATPALMALQGRRIAWASETNEGRHIDNAAMKDLSGGHILTGRHLHKGQVEWKRTHTLILLTNHKPHVTSGGGAEWERIKLINFTESFVSDPDPDNPHQHKKDPTLGDRIDASELPGILNWLIAGCMEWRQYGLNPPESVTASTSQYRSDEDTLGRFIDECCITSVKSAKVSSAELYQEYKSWCFENGDQPMGSKTFSQKIEDKGFRRERTNAWRGFSGIGLLVKRVPVSPETGESLADSVGV